MPAKQENGVEKHTLGILTLRLIESWPFGYVIEKDGFPIIRADGICSSTRQKTFQDFVYAVGFDNPEFMSRQDAQAAVAEQLETARRLVACWNRLLPFTTEQIENGIDLVALEAQRAELVDAIHALAMPVLQSDLYRQDMNVRDAVDNAITLWKALRAGGGG